jgi:hypothetical protein
MPEYARAWESDRASEPDASVAAYDGQSPCCAISGAPAHSNTATDRNVNDESFTDCLPSKDITDAHEASVAAQNPR